VQPPVIGVAFSSPPSTFLFVATNAQDMVSLTKSAPVDHLLARFRPAQPEPTTPPNLAPVAVTVATEDTSPSTQGQEIVRYEPSTQRETRSQVDRIARADAGDLQARLDLIDIEAAEQVLAQRFCKHQPDRSILSYLRDPGEGVAPYQAASAVLEELADQTEETALESALVFRYIQAHTLWRGHPSPAIRSAEDLVRNLDGSDYVQANIVIGTSAQAGKRKYIRLIEDAWGTRWFDKIPQDMRHPTWVRPEECPKRILTQMVANTKQGLALEVAVEGWAESIQRRNDYGARKTYGIKSKATPYIIPSDVATLNTIVNDEGQARRTSDRFFPDEAKEDRLRVELVPPPSTSKNVATPPTYAEGSRPRNRTKKRPVREEEQEEDAVNEGWRESADGKAMIKRVRNHLIRKPIEDLHEEIPETSNSQPSSPEESQRHFSSQILSEPSPPRDPVPPSNEQHVHPRPRECEGPALGAGVLKLINLFSELDNPTYTASRCCDQCRAHVQQVVHCFRVDLKSTADTLANVSTHTFGGDEVSSTQDHGISPYKPQRRRNQLVLSDDSDAD
jgi:hypothetical protein